MKRKLRVSLLQKELAELAKAEEAEGEETEAEETEAEETEGEETAAEDDDPKVAAERRASMKAWTQYARALFSAAEFRFVH